ncbi:unnamed protein product [Darwinula stevensoni]|uniref:Transporter n=1 Tax=Darwinula stevensoni TaxID=69355 RepID=A0A7R9A5H4_9CRUS|nr:unnamed protein product [Darwinula stevensoni]CAG0886486.1 unnamed protein product [Darwinula stevensoni]
MSLNFIHSLNRRMRLRGKPKSHAAAEVASPDEKLDLCSSGEAVVEREAWDSKIQYLLGVVSFGVGLGAVWRFPYLCQKNGGGAFLIPYVVMLFVEGLPVCLLEMGIGQKLRLGSLGVWKKIHPALVGIGLSSTVVSFLVSVYYNVVIMWCFYYLFASFQSPLPWTECPGNETVQECQLSSPTTYYWFRESLDITGSIEDSGGMKWWLALCLLLSWLVVYICIMKGIQTSGKVTYFTAIFPYIVIAVFLGKAVTLPGAKEGLLHLFTPKLEKLGDPFAWTDAAVQAFFTVGCGFGGLIALASYNPVSNDCVFDSIFTAFVHLITSVLTSLVVFAILGFQAFNRFQDCYNENKQLLTSLYPDVLNLSMTDKQYDLYYNMALEEKTIDANEFRNCSLMEELDQKPEGTGILCLVCFLLGLIFTTGSGSYWVTLIDSFSSTGLLLVGCMELVIIVYGYGMKRFVGDIKEMTGRNPGYFCEICWRYLSPFLLVALFITTIYKSASEYPGYYAWNKEIGRNELQQYPLWALCLGVGCLVLTIIPVPIGALYYYLIRKRKEREKTPDEEALNIQDLTPGDSSVQTHSFLHAKFTKVSRISHFLR